MNPQKLRTVLHEYGFDLDPETAKDLTVLPDIRRTWAFNFGMYNGLLLPIHCTSDNRLHVYDSGAGGGSETETVPDAEGDIVPSSSFQVDFASAANRLVWIGSQDDDIQVFNSSTSYGTETLMGYTSAHKDLLCVCQLRYLDMYQVSGSSSYNVAWRYWNL